MITFSCPFPQFPVTSGPDGAGGSGLHACGASSPGPTLQGSRSHPAGGTQRRHLPPLRRPTALLVHWPISALWKLGTSLGLFPAPRKPVPWGGQPLRLLPSTNPGATPRPRLPASILGGMLRAGVSAKGLSGMRRRWQRRRQPGSATPVPPASLPGHGGGRGAGTGGCISLPGRREGWGGVYLRDAGGEGGNWQQISLANGISGKWKAGSRSAWNCPDFQLETSHGD